MAGLGERPLVVPGLTAHCQGPVCALQRRERCLSVWLWKIYLGSVGGGEQGHFQSEQVTVKEEETTCPESWRALELLTMTLAPHLSLSCLAAEVTIPSINTGNRSLIWILGGVKRQTGRSLGSNPHSLWPSGCGKQRSQEQQRVAQLTARCLPPPPSVTAPACLVLS